MTQRSPNRVVLRAAAAWGTSVLAVRMLGPGESFRVGDGPGAAIPKPEGSSIPELPIRAVAEGFQIDPRGATGGELHLRGGVENPALLARNGASVVVVPGDWGLLQYRSLSVFFQFTAAAPDLPPQRRLEPRSVLSALLACAIVACSLTLLWLFTERVLPKPIELMSRSELLEQYGSRRGTHRAAPASIVSSPDTITAEKPAR